MINSNHTLFALRSQLYRWRQQLAVLAASTDPTVRSRAERLRKLKGAYSGKRCFIMGNGPSLNKMDLALLADDLVWGTNRCYLLFDRVTWRPAFFTAVDKLVVPDNRAQIDVLPGQLPQTRFFYPVEFRAQGILNSYPNVFWFNEKSMAVDMAQLPEGTFTRDASRHVYAAFTVTVAALQLAVYLGFNPIYLIGCDTSYARIASDPLSAGSQERLVSKVEADPNHFDPTYFNQGKKFHEPHVARMLFHYHEAHLVCDSMGVKVFNATEGGNLEEFPRVEYNELFSG